MPVGKIRFIQNWFDPDWTERLLFYAPELKANRTYRVNAVKGYDGIWREYESGHVYNTLVDNCLKNGNIS